MDHLWLHLAIVLRTHLGAITVGQNFGRHVGSDQTVQCMTPNLTDHLNTVDQTRSIQFTHEVRVEGMLLFLDALLVRKNDGSIKCLV